MAGGSCRSHQRRNRTSHPTNDDVARGAGLENDRVEQHIAAQAQQRQASSQAVHPGHKQQRSAASQGNRNQKRLAAAEPARRQGTATGALHLAIKLLFPEAIENASGSGSEGATAQCAGQPRQGQGPALTERHATEGGGQQQRDQAWLGNLQPRRQLDPLATGNNLVADRDRDSNGHFSHDAKQVMEQAVGRRQPPRRWRSTTPPPIGGQR